MLNRRNITLLSFALGFAVLFIGVWFLATLPNISTRGFLIWLFLPWAVGAIIVPIWPRHGHVWWRALLGIAIELVLPSSFTILLLKSSYLIGGERRKCSQRTAASRDLMTDWLVP